MLPQLRTLLHRELHPYHDTWNATDPRAKFKSDVANDTVTDLLPTLKSLSRTTGISVPCLARTDYETGKSTPEDARPAGFADWLVGMAAINEYFDRLAR